MKNKELEMLTDWKFCKIPPKEKGPRYNNWQQLPISLNEIPQQGNVGVLLGPHSNGVAAIDFDGQYAWDYWNKKFSIDLSTLNTISWTSNKPARCQMAFKIPKEYWDYVKTFKDSIMIDSETREGIEFRWAGSQSVLPPSIHPDTNKPYEWVISPEYGEILTIPDEVLCWVLEHHKEEPKMQVLEVNIENLTTTHLDECEKVLRRIKEFEPVLSYEDWIQVTWATVSHIGTEAGIALMRELWPEQERNEYAKLLKNYNLQKSPKIGSLVHRAAKHNTVTNNTTYKIREILGIKKLPKGAV